MKRVMIGVAYKGKRSVEYFKNGEKLGHEVQYGRHTVEEPNLATMPDSSMLISPHELR